MKQTKGPVVTLQKAKNSKSPDIEEEHNSEDEKQELQTIERANNLARHYESVKDRTVDDNTVLGVLKDIHTSDANNNIYIDVDVPGEDADETFRFQDPKLWSETYKFVRWVRHYGYDADSFPGMLEGECQVEVEQENGNYDLVIPEEDSNIVERVPRAGRKVNNFLQWYKREKVILTTIPALTWLIYGFGFLTGLFPRLIQDPIGMVGVYIIIFTLLLVTAHIEVVNHR